MDQENTCSRALCECDLQQVKDIVASSNKWKRNRHLKFGFDRAESCNAESAGLAARGTFLFACFFGACCFVLIDQEGIQVR